VTRSTYSKSAVLAAFLILAAISGAAALLHVEAAPVTANGTVVPEGKDFATLELRDPWDMSEFTDISQWLNRTGPENYLLDIQVVDGLFSARTASGFSYFHLLYGGYPPAVRIGNIGLTHPIPSSEYACFYMAMEADAPTATPWYQLAWGDESIPPGVSGQTSGTAISNGIWKLYAVDLRTYVNQDGTHWADVGVPEWRSLRMTPSLTGDTTFTIDWVRLTDCSPVYFQITGLPASTAISIWAGTGTPERQILVEENADTSASGTYDWDIQGLAPASYNFYVMPAGLSPGQGIPYQQGNLTVNAAPIAKFIRPSAQSGEDHPTTAGNPWDMSDANDIYDVECVSTWALQDGKLVFETPSPSSGLLPPGCIGAGANEADPRILLKSNDTGIQFQRFLSFRLYQNGEWSLPEEGMIGRWIWTIQTPTGDRCRYVSRDIAFEVNWQTYEIDFHDDWNGMPDEAFTLSGNCPIKHWKEQQGLIIEFRFDPNENITNFTFNQELDWMRLTRIDRVTQGQLFPVQVSFNKPPGGIATSFYYTSDPVNDPFQQSMNPYSPSLDPTPGPYAIYLPLTMQDSQGGVQNLVWFTWDTAGVSPYNDYYVCVQADDSYNQTTYCSTAPMEIVAP